MDVSREYIPQTKCIDISSSFCFKLIKIIIFSIPHIADVRVYSQYTYKVSRVHGYKTWDFFKCIYIYANNVGEIIGFIPGIVVLMADK
jgi:hypothetical protein